jgi:hypothetical protein
MLTSKLPIHRIQGDPGVLDGDGVGYGDSVGDVVGNFPFVGFSDGDGVGYGDSVGALVGNIPFVGFSEGVGVGYGDIVGAVVGNAPFVGDADGAVEGDGMGGPATSVGVGVRSTQSHFLGGGRSTQIWVPWVQLFMEGLRHSLI